MKNYFINSSKTLESINDQIQEIKIIADKVTDCLSNNNKLLIAGNGGSASDALHFAGELTCTYDKKERKAYNAIALANNISSITAWANDFEYENFFVRQLEAIGTDKDVLFLLSTSGGDLNSNQSINLINAAKYAKENKIFTIALLGKNGGELKKIVDLFTLVKSDKTSHIQEAHIAIIHYICETLETI